MTACARTSGSSSPYASPSCTQLPTAAIAYERGGTDGIDPTLQALSDSCSDEYDIAVDYLSNSRVGAFGIDSCDELLDYGIRSEADALQQDRRCSLGESQVAVGPDWLEGGLGWDSAREHSGTVQRVCGRLMSARATEHGTFVNVGRDYPSADRFTFILWDVYLEPIGPRATVCGSGEI